MNFATKEKLKDVVIFTVLVTSIVLILVYMRNSSMENNLRIAQRKETVCPSFLSIARSARDTMIVMRNEPLCNRYVLDNLK